MKPLIHSALLLIVIGCNPGKQSEKEPIDRVVSKEEQKDNSNKRKFNFKGRAFDLTTDFDLENCQALNRCDCCTSQLVLQNETEFIYILGCEGSSYYTKGKYVTHDSSLTLDFDSVRVSHLYNWDADQDSTAEEYTTKVEKLYLGASSYSIDSCKRQILIYSIGSADREYGLIDPNWSEFNLRVLQNSKYFRLLNKE